MQLVKHPGSKLMPSPHIPARHCELLLDSCPAAQTGSTRRKRVLSCSFSVSRGAESCCQADSLLLLLLQEQRNPSPVLDRDLVCACSTMKRRPLCNKVAPRSQ
eukprot:TRINITY_DN963_c0_g1_i8.p1 TRINITY_DN963_c0_g1~~TRINITY_DN963_c0_g1_i8.p1  ORF type:complete len:103 (-),score=5.06 TRINITY_DN963_c0_g1_i8:129-437(-)